MPWCREGSVHEDLRAFRGCWPRCLLSGVALAKPLYITVPAPTAAVSRWRWTWPSRTRGRWSCACSQPANLDAFIRAQGDLRRAYETPPTLLNPGRGLSRGLNAVTLAGHFVLLRR